MKKLILRWLFGTDDIKDYMELLRDCQKYIQRLLDEINDHVKTLNIAKKTTERAIKTTETALKLIQICENHGIDVDAEIQKVELENNDENNNTKLMDTNANL